MILAAKGLEALGIACVITGLIQGIQSVTLWVELYLSIIGILLFLVGRRIEKYLIRKKNVTGQSPGH